MSSWCDGPFLGFDTETTGVDVVSDRIVTAALVHRDGASTRVRTWLLDPGVEIPDAASSIHGITTDRARAEGVDPSVALEEMATVIAQAQHEGVPVVAYNAAFDLATLDHELTRHGLRRLADRLGRECLPVVDPLVLDRGLDPDREGQRTLGDLCAHYGVPDHGNLHTAEVDVVATLEVLARIAERFPDVGERSLAELHGWQARRHRAWAEQLNARRVEQGLSGPGADPGWPLPRTAAPVDAAQVRGAPVGAGA